ncbi:hypothetical protein [Mycobacterium sp. DBP42]|uniref:hypothetical protein n=1 Tax=Mycobacteriaceae TaxID=1762 RepID=UPI00110D0D97|nr:hypothetical protein [Mycobacterium sp. DBP42]TMS46977.1 hypothetical protein E0T84_29390 [Mycobacterium sp. DBP42]
MRADTATVAIERIANAAKGQPVARLEFGGWVVTIDDAGAVRVPYQDIEGKSIDDLDFCLRSGYAVLQGGDPPKSPKWEPPAPSSAAAKRAVSVLRAARVAAQRQRHWGFHDFYACLSYAWQYDEHKTEDPSRFTVSYRLLVRALRMSLPYPTTLSEYGRNRRREDVLELYGTAIALMSGVTPPIVLGSRRGVA